MFKIFFVSAILLISFATMSQDVSPLTIQEGEVAKRKSEIDSVKKICHTLYWVNGTFENKKDSIKYVEYSKQVKDMKIKLIEDYPLYKQSKDIMISVGIIQIIGGIAGIILTTVDANKELYTTKDVVVKGKIVKGETIKNKWQLPHTILATLSGTLLFLEL